MNPAVVFYGTVFCLFGGLALLGWILKIRAARRAERGEAPEPPEDDDDDQKPQKKCDVCEVALAVVGMPVIVNSRLDIDRTGVRKLHGQTPGYEVVYDESKGVRLCVPHARMLQRMKEQHLAEKRSELAQANARVEHSIAKFEAGIALALARDEWRKIAEEFQGVIEGRGPAPPQLPPAAPVHTVTVVPPEPEEREEEDLP